ncbi:hypothetical protein [Streptococcus parauberis]|uniref:hypothetical protein n=1 Tax=Streptococcus parauberis TaxID=1348 RepID=UPI000789BAD5|nr:hypothetical protein [Streptococcus parauberis]QBX18186.1 hypothetical protein Javan399_0046 [Streptococcus phage Javan399]KYP20816.1 hypothetical protein AKL13_00435 [Streptococcus parauberis]KYP21200.1 hypothetical protein TN39_00358 [Streptococcus parauberis]KYP22404.1 hypothetical protein AKL14_00404 [Streptococcus parauberis]KYP24859.1 hypothetical protein ADO04_01142 [Streptococcus parauberis]
MNRYERISNNKNAGKTFVRAKVTELQKEQLEVLAEMNGTSKDELLNEVVTNFIEFNLDAIGQYEDKIQKAKLEAKEKLNKKVEL